MTLTSEQLASTQQLRRRQGDSSLDSFPRHRQTRTFLVSFFSTASDTSPAAAPLPADVESSSHRPPQKRPSVVGRVFAWLILALLVYVLFIVAEGMLIHLPADTAGTPQPGERIGVVHIHTVASDGSGTIPEVVAAGHEADLSFLAITDHNVSMKASDVANISPDFAIVSGEELTTYSGHYLFRRCSNEPEEICQTAER